VLTRQGVQMTDRGDVTSTDRKSKHGGRAKGKGAGKRCSSEAHAANNNGCLNPSGSSLRKMCAKGGSVGKIGKGRNVKAGDIMEMGGLTLIAIEKEGRLAWEPMNNDDNSGCEQMQEARWLKDSEALLREQRIAQARSLRQKDHSRKAAMFGAENVYRTQRTHDPVLPVPKLLADTRVEDDNARKAGMDKSDPKKYQFIKESLVALEEDYAEQLRLAREQIYQRNRARLNVSANVDDEEQEMESMASKIAKMTDEEFKALALERKQRADADVGMQVSARAGRGGAGRGGAATISAASRGKGIGKSKATVQLNDQDDYRR